MEFDFTKYAENEKKQFEKMSPEEKYRYMLLTQIGNNYSWGSDNPEEADCSGSVALALTGAGWNIRTTANDLLNKIFIKEPNGIDAIFYLTKKPQNHGGRIVPTGTAVHIIGLIDGRVALNMTPPKARIESKEAAVNWGTDNGYTVIVRGACKKRLSELSDKLFYEPDEKLLEVLS